MYWAGAGCGRPSQKLYHIPAPLVQDKRNLVVIFEEAPNVASHHVLDTVQLVALHAHPLP
jgi:hypothetical protein